MFIPASTLLSVIHVRRTSNALYWFFRGIVYNLLRFLKLIYMSVLSLIKLVHEADVEATVELCGDSLIELTDP